ncbi:helix-turn-helix domain-containing protein [Aneurinibacillus migulanus]|uniref:helix-turn-helix domain-containing protein n=1 Tax=Aneurinibacillus migulanus TaxID=47500 RepID=UPI0020A1F57E|nr:helix-turn-helix transcriptional regulator [Aneurinibacillus migulanus]
MSDILGKRIKELREQKGLTTVELSQKSGVSQSTISQIENSKRGASTKTIQKLAKALEVPSSYLLQENTDKAKPSDDNSKEEVSTSDIRENVEIHRDSLQSLLDILERTNSRFQDIKITEVELSGYIVSVNITVEDTRSEEQKTSTVDRIHAALDRYAIYTALQKFTYDNEEEIAKKIIQAHTNVLSIVRKDSDEIDIDE